MKKYFVPALLVFVLFNACKSTPKFSDVADRDWLLVEVRLKPEGIVFDRSKLTAEGFGDIFTLRFDAERINGIGAPNRYFAPYTLASKQAIEIKPVSGTLMAPIHEPEKLKERDYFGYLQNAYKWNFVKGTLELYTKKDDATEAVLIFAPGGKK